MTAQQMYEKYLEAELALLKGQSIRFGDRVLTRANLDEIRRGRAEWERKAAGKSHSVVRFV